MSTMLREREEGLGTVYERHRLWLLIDRLDRRRRFQSVLETPLGRMSGLPGLNPVRFVLQGKPVIQADPSLRVTRETACLWNQLGGAVSVIRAGFPLPFRNRAFDLVLSFHGLAGPSLHAEETLGELCRVCGGVLLLIHPNPTVFSKPDRNRSRRAPSFDEVLRMFDGFPGAVMEQGYVDCPPWPDTGVAIKDRLSGGRTWKTRFWRWSSLDYLTGRMPSQRTRVRRLSFIEVHFPEKFKSLWAHHRYLVYETS
jgi:hypothetical protein